MGQALQEEIVEAIVKPTLPVNFPTAKSFQPSKEIYTTSGSIQDSHRSLNDNTGTDTVFIPKPVSAAPAPSVSLGSVGESLDAAYSKWRNGIGDGSVDLQKRISVGHYGGGIPSHGHAQSGTSYQTAHHPYPYEYTHSSSNGGVAEAGGGGGSNGAYYGSSSIETGIPFDVYGSRPAHVHYAGVGGGEYSYAPYQYDVESHEIASHKGPSEVSQKTLLAKSFLIPLASAAVLGIAAALVSNPLLLQLGTVSGVGLVGGLTPAIVGKRKKRAIRRAYFAQI
ncbi:uncharacterized protein [Drosophila tropicalis]|uniref:uncharacterized protein n=1 Tax=Drosophila tropicalis TaxID=46794 RepID=UPI0035AB8E52